MHDDDLRNMFTAFMQKVIHNAKIDYIRRKTAKIKMEAKTADLHSLRECCYEQNFDFPPQNGFGFEEGPLADIFALLSPKQQQILTLLFVKGFSALEIAEELDCTLDFIYDQKRKSLQKLRRQLVGGKDEI